MKYIITKTIDNRFTYYLDKSNSWNGLKDNAHSFTEKGYAERLAEQHQRQDKGSKVQIRPANEQHSNHIRW